MMTGRGGVLVYWYFYHGMRGMGEEVTIWVGEEALKDGNIDWGGS